MKVIIWILLVVYFMLLIKVILFKYPLSMITSMMNNPNITLDVRIKGGNFIPLRTIVYYILGGQNFRIAIENIMGNIIAFIPLGFLIPITFKRISKLKKIIIISFLISLLFEIIQLFTGIGSFDIDDILLNVFGAIIGYVVYLIIIKLSKKFHGRKLL